MTGTIRRIILAFVVLVGALSVSAQELISTSLVHEGQSYASFTSLVYYKGCFYCAFREAHKHVDPSGADEGVIRIMKSKKADKWEEFLTYQMKGTDLRDPSLTPIHGKVLLTVHGVIYKDGKTLNRETYSATFSSKADSQSSLQKLSFDTTTLASTKSNSHTYDQNWLWHSYRIADAAYGFVYLPKFAFVKSTDGIHYQVLGEYKLGTSPNETAVTGDKKQLIAIARAQQDNQHALLGYYSPKTNQWDWTDSGYQIGGPSIILIKDDIYVCGRSYDKEKRLTTLFKLNKETHQLQRVLDLPSGSDCSYPGMVYRNHLLYISHYHSDDHGGSSVYLSVVNIK